MVLPKRYETVAELIIMDTTTEPVVIFIGNFGSGKTEVAVNFAVDRISSGIPVQIADLDLVNPYFRSRELRDVLEANGIEVIMPDGSLADSELPIVVPQIKGIIERPKGVAILDVGGDDIGARVLGSFHPVLSRSPHDMLQVLNICRPFTDTVSGAVTITREIELASRLRVTAVVGNSHLMDETTAGIIREGYRFTTAVAGELGVPVKFIACEKRLLPDLYPAEFECPLLPITRQLLPPWRRRQKLGPQNFLLS